MYFPFLRGKQNELLALRECSDKLASSGKVIPIIEPVTKGHAPVIKCLKTLDEKNVDHIVIYNSANGDIGKSPLLMSALFDKIKAETSSTQFAYILNSNTTKKEVLDFLSNIDNRGFSFIHMSSFSDPKFLLGVSAHENFHFHIFINSHLSRGYNRYSAPVLRINFPVIFTQAVDNNLLSFFPINYHGGLIL